MTTENINTMTLLFPQTGDVSDSVGSYGMTIDASRDRKREKLLEIPQRPVGSVYASEDLNDGMIMQ